MNRIVGWTSVGEVRAFFWIWQWYFGMASWITWNSCLRLCVIQHCQGYPVDGGRPQVQHCACSGHFKCFVSVFGCSFRGLF